MRVGLVFGGMSPEHEVSLVSARFVASVVEQAGFELITMGIDRDGHWHVGPHAFNTLEALLISPDTKIENHAGITRGITALEKHPVDVIFPLIHGATGEDGAIQGWCEMLDLPYVGGDLLNQSLCLDKLVTRQILSFHGFPQPPFCAVYEKTFREARHEQVSALVDQVGLPAFVKPSRAGSSIGISCAHTPDELAHGLDTALEFDVRAIVERRMEGMEVEFALLGDAEPFISVPAQVVPENPFYDYEEKYLKNSTQFIIPAPLQNWQLQKARAQAAEAWRLFNGYGMARVDFFIHSEEVFLNEINTVPGFTSISMYPRLLDVSGHPPVQAVKTLIDLAMKRAQSGLRHRRFRSGSQWFKSST